MELNYDNLTPPRRPWLQFSLRTFLVATVALGVCLAWFGSKMHHARERQEAVDKFESMGGTFHYANSTPELRLFGSHFADYVVTASLTTLNDTSMAYLKTFDRLRILSVDDVESDTDLTPLLKFDNLRFLRLTSRQMTNNDLSHFNGLADLTELEEFSLDIHGSHVTDAGLAHLSGMNNLQRLILYDLPITDAGLVHLEGLTNLQELWLHGTKISGNGLVHLHGLTKLTLLSLNRTLYTQFTDTGIKDLQQALPNCKIGT